MKKNAGFMLFETLIVSTLVLGTLVFLYVQLTNIRKSYYISFKYNTIEGLYHANNIAKHLEKTGYQAIKDNLADNNYLDITNCVYSTSLCNIIVENENIKQVLFVNKDISSLKNDLDNINLDKNFKKFIKKTPALKKNCDYRLLVAFNNDTYATVGVGVDLSELTPYVLTNMINNNGFESGNINWNFDTQNSTTKIDSTFKKSGNSSLSFISSSTDTNAIYQSVSLKANHIYYASEYLYLDENSSGYTNIYLNDSRNYANVSFNTLKAKKWNNVSSVFNAETLGNYQYNILVSNTPNKIYVDNVMLIDLTETFGIGNEPDLEWCNSHIKFFENTTTLYK